MLIVPVRASPLTAGSKAPVAPDPMVAGTALITWSVDILVSELKVDNRFGSIVKIDEEFVALLIIISRT